MSNAIDSYSINLVSVAANGTQGNGFSRTLNFAHSLMSADGRYVLFFTLADNFVPPGNDLNLTQDVFLKDMLTGDLQLISGIDGHTGNKASLAGSLTSNGQYAVFYSSANNLLGLGADNNNKWDVILVNLATNTRTLVSAATDSAGHVIQG